MKKINTQEIPVKRTFASLWMTVAMVLAFTACSEEDLVQPANGQAGTLHITSVSVDGQQVGGRSRAVADDETQYDYENAPYNQSLNSFGNGDKIKLSYNFGGAGDDAPAPVYATFNDGVWTIDGNIAPRAEEESETWGLLDMTATANAYKELIGDPEEEEEEDDDIYDECADGGEEESEYAAAARVLGIVAGEGIESANIRLLTDFLYATIADGSISIDKNLTSPTLGATTISFKHASRALLCLPQSAVSIDTENSYVVGGQKYSVTGLATLWAVVKDGEYTYYYPLTAVGNNWQAIVYSGVSLVGFKAVLYATEVAAENTPMVSSTGSEPSTITLDLPFKVDNPASNDIELEENTQYPLTLNINPVSAEVNFTIPNGKPGWDVNEDDEEVLTNDNYLTYNAADQYFEVNAPAGMQLLNKWMTGEITTAELKAYNFVGCSSIPNETVALSANVRLMQDIELTAPEEGANWTAIGTESSPYTGTFDGNGHTITGMVINATTGGQGFVGYLGEGGQIKNLTFEDAQVASTEGRNVGIVAGVNNGMVDNCHTVGTSSVNAKGYVGGIVGRNENVITNCTNVAQVAATSEGVGGITGDNYSFVSSCINSGSVIGTWLVGGIAGSQFEAEMIACGNTGSVSGDKQVGGIVGDNSGTVAGSWTIDTEEKDYDGDTPSIEDGVGYGSDNANNIIECYSVASKSVLNSKLDKINEALWQYYKGNSASTGLFWKETTDNWPTTVQQEVSGNSNPYMVDLKFIAPTGYNDPGGTFEVGNAKGLMILNEWMTSNLDNNENFKAIGFDGSGDIVSITSRMGVDVKLVKDITLPTVGEGESNWKPIKSYNGGYTKTFDGQGHTIRNLTINQPSADKIGFVGHLYGGAVKNLTLENVKIKGNSYVGGIVGHMETWACKVENCTVSGEITAKSGYVGGIAAYVGSSESFITGCINHANINVTSTSDNYNVGGIVGRTKGICLSCGNTGNIVVASNYSVGGIVGYAYDSSYAYGCWSIDNVEKGWVDSSNSYVDATEKDGFGWRGSNASIQQCYIVTNSASITNSLMDAMNNCVENSNIYPHPNKYYWTPTNDGWPTLTTTAPASPAQGN